MPLSSPVDPMAAVGSDSSRSAVEGPSGSRSPSVPAAGPEASFSGRAGGTVTTAAAAEARVPPILSKTAGSTTLKGSQPAMEVTLLCYQPPTTPAIWPKPPPTLSVPSEMAPSVITMSAKPVGPVSTPGVIPPSVSAIAQPSVSVTPPPAVITTPPESISSKGEHPFEAKQAVDAARPNRKRWEASQPIVVSESQTTTQPKGEEERKKAAAVTAEPKGAEERITTAAVTAEPVMPKIVGSQASSSAGEKTVSITRGVSMDRVAGSDVKKEEDRKDKPLTASKGSEGKSVEGMMKKISDFLTPILSKSDLGDFILELENFPLEVRLEECDTFCCAFTHLPH